jgi:uncharacterized protein DUF4352
MFCVKCGSRQDADARFCTKCGLIVPPRISPEVAHTARLQAASAWSCPCGNVNTGGFWFCARCGGRQQQGLDTSRPPNRLGRANSRGVLLFLALFVIVGIVIAILIFNGDEAQVPQNTTNAPSPKPSVTVKATPVEAVQPPPEPIPAPRPRAYTLGQSVSIGYWSYRCDRAVWTSMLGNSFTAERANAAFLVLDLTAQNNDNSASTLPPLHLVDTEGRIYDASSAGMLNDGFFGPLEKLNPSVSKRGYVVFDVPRDREYKLQVSGGFNSSESELITLAPPAKPQDPPN